MTRGELSESASFSERGKGPGLSQPSQEVLVWWFLIAASFPISYYAFGIKTTNTKAGFRRVKLCSTYLVASFISYVMWLLAFRPTYVLAELSPFGGFLLAVIFPWVLGLKKRG